MIPQQVQYIIGIPAMAALAVWVLSPVLRRARYVADALAFPCPCDVDHAVGGLDDGWVAEFGACFVFEDEGGLP